MPTASFREISGSSPILDSTARRRKSVEIPSTPVKYRLDLSKTKQQEIDVEMTIDLPRDEPLDVVMPHISPGSPTNSLNHDRRIRNVRVSDAKGRPVEYHRLKSGGFRIEQEAKGPVTVHYTVKADQFSHVRNSLSEDHAYINGPAAMMYIKGRDTDLPSTVELTNVPGADWKSLSSLPEIESIPHAFYATCYQDVADTNIFATPDVDIASEVLDGTELLVNVHGTPPWAGLEVNGATAQESLDDLKALFRVFKENFGEFPLDRYHHIGPRPEGVRQTDKYVVNKHYFHNGPRSAGGYEHYHGHELLLHKKNEKGIKRVYESDGRRYERGIMAHEIVHKLLAKNVTHDGIDSEDLSSTEKTDGLWVTEGVTDWTGGVLERQAGLMTGPQYVEHLQNYFNRYVTDMDHDHTSPTDDSLDAHCGNSKYYNKGAVAASLLDLELRHHTGGQRGLFDVLRGLKRDFGGTGVGFALDDMERLSLEQVKGNSAGEARVQEFFDKHLRGRQEFDLNRSLAHVGYRVEKVLKDVERECSPCSAIKAWPSTRWARSLLVETPGMPDEEADLPTLGLSMKSGSEGWEVLGVKHGGPAFDAGLGHFEGKTAKELSFDEETGVMTFHFEEPDMFTGEMEKHMVRVPSIPAEELRLVPVDEPTPAQLALRGGWQAGTLG